MFGYISEVGLFNVQSHKSSIFKFKETGIHRIAAQEPSNSYGKSVLRKALMAVFTPRGKDKVGRETLINDGGDSCTIIVLSTTGILITLFLHLEEKYSYYEIEYGDTKVRKYLRDDYQIILDICGFHYLKDEDYSLNFYITKSALPFTHFRPRLNYKVLESAKELPEYRLIIDVIEENLKRMERELRILDNTRSSYQFHINSLETVDLESLVIEERMVSNWVNYIEPIEIITPRLQDAVNSLKSIEVITYINTKYVSQHVEQLVALDKINAQLANGVKSKYTLEQAENYSFDIKAVEPYMTSLSELQNSLVSIGQLSNLVKDLGIIPEPINVSLVDSSIKQLTVLETISNTLQSLIYTKDAIASLHQFDLPTVHVEQIKSISASVKELGELIDLNNKMIRVEQFHLPTDYRDQLFSLSEATKELSSLLELESNLEDSLSQYQILQQGLSALESQLDICKECGQLITSMEVSHEH